MVFSDASTRHLSFSWIEMGVEFPGSRYPIAELRVESETEQQQEAIAPFNQRHQENKCGINSQEAFRKRLGK